MAWDHNQNGNRHSPASAPVRALERGEIEAYYLPKVDLRSGRVIGVEALARCDDPGAGLIAAADFLGEIDAAGLMRDLTERMIQCSIRAAGDWWRSGLGLQLSVNLSTSIFSEPEWSLDQFVSETLSGAGLPGKALQFEITEDALVNGGEDVASALKRLSALGATIAIDDFGTGHFSFRQLMDLPIEEVKIDRSLILAMDGDDNRAIVRSAIHVAHQLGIQVVAEGVETDEAWRQLRSIGAERAQGFLIAKPLPARQVPAWLAAWNHRARELSSTRRVRRRSKAVSKPAGKTPAQAPA
jgi:EAL domain-containing protein (putative c-di-GMP-specific phosphodiesterase class I)